VINVTKTFLPPLSEYTKYLKKIWYSGWITNNGELLCLLEYKLKNRLKVENIAIVNSGTAALQIALKALDIKGEVVTTPFSYVATTSAIVWEGARPVFADIDPDTLCIDPNKIAKKITSRTSAILATHVYGNACDIERISKVARKHNVKVIYDAAHAFSVTYDGRSLLEFGDASVLSFHATKFFHTAEGGAIVTKDRDDCNRILYMRNFGHMGSEDFSGIGTNGKLSELHAAMGLSVLPYINRIINKLKKTADVYDQLLENPRIKGVKFNPLASRNYAYYPIIFKSEKILIKIKDALFARGIYPRRYFYPSLNQLPYVDKCSCPVSEKIAKRVLCLPIYYDLSIRQAKKVGELVLRGL